MELKTGTWFLTIFGMDGNLTINASLEGELQGSLSNFPFNEINGSILGSFDETSLQIVFGIRTELINTMNPGSSGSLTPIMNIAPMHGLLFKGYLFSKPRDAQPGLDIIQNLVGTLEVSDPAILDSVFHSNSRRTNFGWLAQIKDIL